MSSGSDSRLSRYVPRIAVALILGALVYFASPKVAERLAIYYLEDFDITNVHIDIGRPGLRGININTFEAQWQGFDVKLQSADISYTISGLFNSQIDAISLKQLTVIDISVDDEKHQIIEVPAVLFTWPELLAETFPGRIEISEILLGDTNNKLTGNLSYSDNTLSMHGDVHLQWLLTDHSYTLTIDPKRKLEIVLFQAGAQPGLKVSIQNNIGTQAMQLHGELYAGAGILLEVLQPYLKDTGVQEITGALTLKFQLETPRQESGAIALENVQISGSIIPDLVASLRLPEYENYSALLNWNETGTVTVSSRHIDVFPGPHIAVSGVGVDARFSIGAVSAELMSYTRLISSGISILPGASIKMENLLDPGDLELSTNTPLSITVNQEAQSLGIKSAVLNLELSRFTYNQVPYYLQPLNLEMPDIHLDWNEDLDLTVGVRNSNDSLKTHIYIQTDQNSLAINTQINLNSQSSLIDELFSNWAHDFDISGSLSIDLTASLDFETLSLSGLSGDLILENSNLLLDGVSLGGVNLNMPFHLLDTQFVTDWANVKVDQANAGVELSAIEGSVRYSPSTLNIGAFKMQLLGGEAHSEALDYAFGSPSAHTQISFSNLQLPRLVALADDEIQASGIIDGSIRLRSLFGEDGSIGLVIEEGSLSARPPGGRIQYRIGNQGLGLAKQSDIDFALTALENFDYHKLDSTISLKQDGELKLGVSLLGSNPQVKDGRQIQYNLNIDQNLFTLLRSLQLSNKLSDRIGEKLSD